MENSADALKMAFAVFAFVIALAMAFFLIGKVKERADQVLYYTDNTNYYEWQDGTYGKDGRKVGVETVISALHNKDKNETYMVVIYKADGTEDFNSKTGNIQEKIKELLSNNNKEFYETTVELHTEDGSYSAGEDGIILPLKKGDLRTYVIYREV